VAAVGQIDSYSIAAKKLTIIGTNLPTDQVDVHSITYGSTDCVIDDGGFSATQVSCELQDDLVAGDLKPIYKT